MIRTPGDRWVVGIVTLLFLVPTLVLVFGKKPDRFGFQMYSGYGVPSATWTDDRGTEHEVDLRRVVARSRGEIAWTAILPEELCVRFPDATAVEVRQVQPGEPRVRSLTC